MNKAGHCMVSILILSLLLGCFGNTPLQTLNYPAHSDIKHKNHDKTMATVSGTR